MNEGDKDFQKRTEHFNRLFFKAILFAAIAGLLIGLGFNMAKAAEAKGTSMDDLIQQSVGTDPYPFAQRAVFCYRLNPLSKALMAPKGDALKTENGKDYRIWSYVRARTTAWSVLYGHSLRQIFAEVPNAPTNEYGFVDAKYNEDCKLQGAIAPSMLTTLERDHYAKKWESERQNILPKYTVPANSDADKGNEAAWCTQSFDYGLQQLYSDPKGSFGMDPDAQNGQARVENARRLFKGQLDWWRQRNAALNADKAGDALKNQQTRMNGMLVILDNAKMKPAALAMVKSYFIKQETNFCAAKSKALQKR